MNIKPLTNPCKRYRSRGKGIIEGYWNEDNSPFTITCPEQLQSLLLKVLNNLKKIDEKNMAKFLCKECSGNPTKCKKAINIDSICYQEIQKEAKAIVKYLVGK